MDRLRNSPAPVLAVALPLLLAAGILLLLGHNPVEVADAFADRVLLRRSGWEESLVAMAPILIGGLAAWIAARVGMWNIGIDGQVVAGAVSAAAVAPLLDGWPRVAMWTAVTLIGVIAGSAWMLVPAALRVRRGINEIVTTIMMTYVAFSLASWLVKGPLKDESLVAPATQAIDVARRLPRLLDSRIHLGVIVVVLIVILAAMLARWTGPGILSRLVGESPGAAQRIGVSVDRYVLWGMLLSGGVAALAGVTEVLATRGAVQGDWRPSLTLPAFAVLFLARRWVLGLIPAALVLGMFAYASTVLPRSTGLAPDFFPMLEGLLLVFLAIERWGPERLTARKAEARRR